MNAFNERDFVEVQALPVCFDESNSVAPGLGDRGAVVQILRAGTDVRYVVESIDRKGRTRWIAEFDANALLTVQVRTLEPLTFSSMASGERALLLKRQVSWEHFPAIALNIASRLNAKVVSRADDPTTRLITIEVDRHRYWVTWEEQGDEVSLEPCDRNAGAAMSDLRSQLARSRLPFDARFKVDINEPRPRLQSGCVELDFLMTDELGQGGSSGDTIEESLALELAQQIQDIRAGRVSTVRNGSDAVFISLTPHRVELEYAVPGATRPGVPITLTSFTDVFVRWFEHVNAPLGSRIANLIWPRRFET